MSKALEALERLEYIADKLADWNGIDIAELDEDFDYSNLFIQLREALTPPTADEVCEVLKKYYDRFEPIHSVTFDGEDKSFSVETKRNPYRGIEISYVIAGEVGISHDLPPYLVVLIGRFYEGLEE